MTVSLVLIAALLATAGLAFTVRRATDAVYATCLLITTMSFVISLFAIAAPPAEITLPLGLPWLGAHFHRDALAAAFLAIVNFGGAAASLYAIGYGQHEPEPGRVLPFFPVFLAGMNLVILAADAYSFLFAWELMSLASWALVMARHRAPDTARAGFVYLLMAGFGTFALLLSFGLLAGAGAHYDFASIRAHQISPTLAAIALALTFIGAGSKAGLVPLHVWLPLAHPAAPSHVSALMSGVMTKVAVYAFIRITFDLMGPPSWWWSLPALLLGAITAVLGILHALLAIDIKRVLAYSTIENIGIIFVALGLALAFKASHLADAAALALTAGMFHAANHMLFKSVLFFGAGAIIGATGEQDMEKLGGLIHGMKYTSFAFLMASLAISALPPFNGFASEWLIFQSILVSPALPQMGLRLVVPAVGVMLALAAAFAAACFVRAFGTIYLGRPRGPAAAVAREADRFCVAAMLACAAMCLLTGIFPCLVIDVLQPVATVLVAGQMPTQATNAWLSIIPVAARGSSYNGLLMFGFLAASAALTAFVVHRLASRSLRRAPAWDCGYPGAGPTAQYSATSLSQPIRRVFGTIMFGSHEEIDMPAPGDMRAARIIRTMPDPIWDYAYMPLARAVDRFSTILNKTQFLTIRRYLSMVFVTLVTLLVVLALWG